MGTEQINSNKHHRQEIIKGSQHVKNNFNHFKSILQKSEKVCYSILSINTPTKPLSTPHHHTHSEERIWAGRTPRAPDAPKIKHDGMKQFYMIDMGRKM